MTNELDSTMPAGIELLECDAPAPAAEPAAPGPDELEKDAVASGATAPGGPANSAEDADPYAGKELTVIGGFRVLPFADRLPLIEGPQFEDLVQSVKEFGQAVPVELHKGLLADGRNRVRAVEELKRRGHDIEVRTVEWVPRGDETIEQHVYLVNVPRRHLTDDQRVTLATSMLPQLRAANARRQAATRFGGKNTVNGNSDSPVAGLGRSPSPPASGPGTTTEQLAALAGVSLHKARNAIALCDAVEAGEVPREEMTLVEQGNKPLRDALPPSSKRKAKRPCATPPGRPPASKATRTVPPGVAAEDDADAPAPTPEEINRRWERFKDGFAVSDHRVVRAHLLKKITEEQAAYDS